MEDLLKKCLWQNFGAAIDMLQNALSACPEDVWVRSGKFYFLAFHTTIFLDYFLARPVKEFDPQLPYFLIDESQIPALAIDDVMPAEEYTKEHVQKAISRLRKKCEILITEATVEELASNWIEPAEIPLHGLCPAIVENYSLLEILFYNLRHVQHHVGQLNLLLRQETDMAPEWVALVE